MNKITLLFLLTVNVLFAQKNSTVAEIAVQVKPGTTEELVYGFAEGDQILLTFEEENGKKLNEVSVSEFPDILKFKAMDVKKVKKQAILVSHKGVYKFLFKNTDKEPKQLSVLIQRTPATEENRNFNTTVKWVTE
ncbi:MAG TPA: hypothetical protein PK776_11340, partial [Flavobacterium sp.]|nr:hypothetical protein [Flavobacterium sp.]